MAEDYTKKLQSLLRKLFQFESADLDFGIYRIMNKKRDVIEKFIDKDLIAAVDAEFGKVSDITKASAQKEIDELKTKIQKTLGSSALLPSGEFNPKFIDTPIGADLAKQYKERIAAYNAALVSDEYKAEIFNHIYQFFSRYYDNGDFMSMRRYSAKQKFAVPYNGEEVLLHWANKDQYYIKTGEHFFNYAFRVGEYTVRFQIVQAETSVNNIKGENRFFVLTSGDGNVTHDAKAKELVVLFEYKALTEAEKSSVGTRIVQDALNEQAKEAILAAIPDAGLKAGFTRETEGKTPLVKHLATYAKRNTSDFFIHKDLEGFLTRELDFYIKNEMFDLDDLGTDKEEPIEQYLNRVRVMKAISLKIIAFLAQIEDFQKKLFEKKKFIISTRYGLTIGNINEEFYSDIAACDAQWDEWKTLFHFDEQFADLFNINMAKKEKRISFLKSHPTLIVDTHHFENEFVNNLLGTLDNIEEITDGLLIQSENWQALHLLTEKYRSTIRSIFIDPPYNTFATKILYKNEFEHASWLSLLENRLTLAKKLLDKKGIACTTIDDYEFHRLQSLLEEIFGIENHLATVVIRNNPSGRSTVKGIAINHEYGIFFSNLASEAMVGRIPHTDAQRARYDESDADGKSFEWENFRKSSAGSYRFDRPKQYFPLYYDKNLSSLRIPKMEWQEETRTWKVLDLTKKTETPIWPIDDSKRERVWRYGIERTQKVLPDTRVEKTKEGLQIYTKKYLQTRGSLPRTWWDKTDYSARDNGTRSLSDLFGTEKPFDFPKAPATVMDSIRVCSPGEQGIVLDYFAGSGTTGHAVINLNREDDEGIRFILIEMADYFETVLLPRIKKVTFTPDWKDGKPKRMATPEEAERSPRIIKIIRLEQYEDTLNNIEFKEAGTVQKTLMDMEGYLLRYMLDFETRESSCRMNVAKLERPFEYTLRITRDNQLSNETVDLVETFNYLLGLKVKRIRTFKEDGTTYRVVHGETLAGQSTTVIWRTTVGLDLKKDKKFIEETLLKDPKLKAERIYLNGDFHVEGALPIEPEFQRLMGA